jgi:exonuclease SbcD
MKVLQLSDLHLGKRLKEYSLIEDQKYVLDQALTLIKEEHLEALLLCGDIYDSSVPSAEATSLLDYFLTQIHKLHTPCFIISGNHDSADKLHFGSDIFNDEGIHVVTRVIDSLHPFKLGDVNFYLLPFSRPADINVAFNVETKSYSEALSYVVKKMDLKKEDTNILLAHQTVLPTSGKISLGGSEEIMLNDEGDIGDVGAVSSSIFKDFDYVALGHIHKPQTIAKNARYSGSLLKYHKDEANNEKSFTILDITHKKVDVTTSPIKYLHDVVKVEGKLDDILHSRDIDKNAYLFVSLLDKSLLDDPMAKLKVNYPYAAWIEYKSNNSGLTNVHVVDVEKVAKDKLFADFYYAQTKTKLSEEQLKIVASLLKENQ